MRRCLCAVAFLGSAGLLGTTLGCQQSKHADSAQEFVRPVKTLKLQRKDLVRTTEQPARIEAYEEAPLYAKIEGYVEELLVDIGRPVKKDELLATLHVPDREKELQQKRALVQQAAKSIAVAEAHVEVARAAVVAAQGDAKRWQSEYIRVQGLAADGSVTKQLEDEALQQQTAAHAKLLAAQASLQQSSAKVAKASADWKVAKAGAAHGKAILDYRMIRAPFAGKVTQRNIDVGHFVGPSHKSAKPLFVITNTEKLRVFVDVPEAEAYLVDGGDPVLLRVPALPDFVPDGSPPTVTRTSWSLQGSARTLRTEIELDNKVGSVPGLLRPGMYASASITLEKKENVYSIPAAAVIRVDGQNWCYCDKGGKAEKIAIRLGLRSGDEVEVLSGLEEGDAVIVSNVSSLQEGQAVTAATEGKLP